MLARVVAGVIVVAVIAFLAILLFAGGSKYQVRAVFQNAGQLVKGNQVLVSGQQVGTITDIRLTGSGEAEIVMELDKFTPLHKGTTAVIRATSLSGIANRYVALELGPNSNRKLRSGSVIAADKTTAPVDLDQLFNTLDHRTRKSLQRIIQGSATQYAGKSRQANQSLHYFNPALSTSSQLTRELVRDRVVFKRFVTDGARVVTALAARRGELTDLVSNTNTTASAIASENVALGRTLDVLPDTLRNANTTFVNLRATLDDLDPLVNLSKPATRHLTPFLQQLRPLVHDASPTIHDLRVLISKPGGGNDLTDLERQAPQLANLTDTVFPRSVQALRDAQPVVEYVRPYAPDLTGWFTKFGQGASPYDANGHYARIQPIFNAFQFGSTPGGDVLTFTGATSRLAGLQTRQTQRCPGGAMQPPPDGSAPYRETPTFACDPSTVPPGP
ncbi:MAG: phospholipid/cholesterol/gamma-HCH transport system substrate-binding protein [Thermoleophilaceae bacterium]|jgi:phospholipid/cholesterol/gamma-HCH transport system substrate-binding protein|nr:phospholipid/cholesterol/gamma-HCH transport system substrate-binding protein [Thermoleophilaceae bacterium]